MGRIICQAKIENAVNGQEGFDFSALVDTGTSHLTFPMAWKSKLGKLQSIRQVELETANQSTIKGEMAGPVKIQIEGFPAIYGEVLFVEMEPRGDGSYEPLMGYIVLESCQAGVDILGHRLVHIKYLDLK